MTPQTPSGTPEQSDPSKRKLSEVARHVIQPEGIETTAWPVVAARLDEMRVRFDVWQQGLGALVVAKRADGLYAAGIGGVVISIPRQVGKTFTIGFIIFALCIAFPNLLVIWTAHRTRTHNETFRSMAGMAKKASIAPHIETVRRTNGEQEIEFTNGSRILFGARESGFGRGFAELDILVLDEAQILTEKAMEDMVPATNAAPNGLVLMMGTPPRENDPGEVFTNRRAAALSGDDPDVLYVEMSADEGADPDDRRQWAKANPSYPKRTTESAMLRMRKLLGSVESFMREGLGIWDKKALSKKALDFTAWGKRVTTSPPREGRKVFGVKFSVDGSQVALSAAMKPENGPIHVEGLKIAKLSEGTQWLVDFLVERKETTAQIVIDGKSGVGFLVNALRQNKIPASVILTPTLDQVITAHSMLKQAIVGGTLTHKDQSELNDQVKAAVVRKIGTTGGYGWDAPNGGVPVTLLDAVTLAHWGATITKRRPGRKARVL